MVNAEKKWVVVSETLAFLIEGQEAAPFYPSHEPEELSKKSIKSYFTVNLKDKLEEDDIGYEDPDIIGKTVEDLINNKEYLSLVIVKSS